MSHMSDTAADPAAVDYIVFAPGGIIGPGFWPLTNCKAVSEPLGRGGKDR